MKDYRGIKKAVSQEEERRGLLQDEGEATRTAPGEVRNEAKECLDEMKKISELISEVSQSFY
jgi:hypothetical protein